jgi:hypothetical protein
MRGVTLTLYRIPCQRADLKFTQLAEGQWRAERWGNRGNHADLSLPVRVAVAACHLTQVVGVDRLQGPLLVDQANDLGSGHYVVHPPAVGVPHAHVFDEPDDVTGSAEMSSHIHDVVLVDAPLEARDRLRYIRMRLEQNRLS